MSNNETALLQELVRLTRVLVHPVAEDLLKEEFFDGEAPDLDRLKVYARLDGRSQREVGEAAGVNQSSVSRWSNAWKRKGLVADDGTAVFNVVDFFPDLEKEIETDG